MVPAGSRISWRQTRDTLGQWRATRRFTGRARGGAPNLAMESRWASEAGAAGYLDLSSGGVIAEQVACGWDFGLGPSEQRRARGHFLGL